MSRAEELLHRLEAGGASEVENMISALITEELFLDYKRSATVLPSRALHPDDRKNLAKALSGFGNSDGGVVIWGVDCRQTPQGDVPEKAVVVTDPVAFKTLLDGAVGGLTLPPHGGARNVALAIPGRSEGFVVTFIPAGLDVPYWSADRSAQGYYLRVGSSFGPVPHGVLAGMFGRRPQPLIKARLFAAPQRSPGSHTFKLTVAIELANEGRGVAESLFVSVDVSDGVEAERSSLERSTWQDFIGRSPRWSAITKKDGIQLPPGASIYVHNVTVTLSATCPEMQLTVTAGSANGPGSVSMLVLNRSEIQYLHDRLTGTFETTEAQLVAIRRVQETLDAAIKTI